MMFQQLIQARQSVRKYSNLQVENEKLMQCIEAVRIAPSASNAQPWKFIVVNEADLLLKVAKATKGPLGTFNNFVSQAPVIVVFVIEKSTILNEMGGRIKKKEYPLIDIGIAADHFCLQAAALGLGTCMLGWFDEVEIKRLLQIPDQSTVGLLITLGYAPNNYVLRKKIRKPIEKILRWNKY